MANEIEIKVPDIGGATGVDVIEIMVKPGQEIAVDTPLVTLESDKASMEIPSPKAGVVSTIKIKLGDKLSEGDIILILESSVENAAQAAPATEIEETTLPKVEAPPPALLEPAIVSQSNASDHPAVFAGPAVRRLAREFGVDLLQVVGSGRKARITTEDVQQFVKTKLQEKSSGLGVNLSGTPSIDFSQFGTIDKKPLSKIKRLTGQNVHRSWISIPHVTQFDEADITDLEAFRQSELKAADRAGYKLTLLAFVCKVVARALVVYPQFNASLDASGEHLIYKQYYNIGVAVETPNGLVVPVIREVDQRSISDIAQEMARLSTKARDKGLMPNDMSGGCFTISSLGGIGGTAFTPIVNSPEVAILGLSRSVIKPVYLDGEFKPRLMLPLSLSYDHRVIDGAEAARFSRYLCDSLSDLRKILL